MRHRAEAVRHEPEAASVVSLSPQSAPSAALAHGLLVVAATCLLLYVGRHQWFVGDEWDFLVHRGLHGPDRSLLQPHNEHWTTTPILIYRILFFLFGVRTYIPYLAVLLLLHAAAAHLLWLLMRRVGVSGWTTNALVATFLFNGAGRENLMAAFQITFVGTLVLGLAHILLADHSGPLNRRDVAGLAIGLVNLSLSGLAVPMIVTAGIVRWLRRDLRAAFITTAPLAGVYLGWLGAVGHRGLPHGVVMWGRLPQLPEYVWKGVSAAADRSTVLAGAGPLIVLAVAAGLLRRADLARSAGASAFGAALGAAIIFGVVGPGRLNLGVEQSDSSRYLYVAWALLLPAIGLLLEQLPWQRGVVHAAVAMLALASAVQGFDVISGFASDSAASEQALRRRVLAASHLALSGTVFLDVQPDPVTSPELRVADVINLRRHDALRGTSGMEARLEAMGFVQVRVPGQLPVAEHGGPIVDLAGLANVKTLEGGCVRSLSSEPAEIVLTLERPAGVRVMAARGGELRVLVRGPGDTVKPGRIARLQAGVPTTIDLAVTQARPVLVLPAGDDTICGVDLRGG